jgi:hypothetical protein
MQYIISNNNTDIVFEYSRIIYIKTHFLIGEIRRLNYFIFHAQRCKKTEDVIKLILMAVATLVLIISMIEAIKQDCEQLINQIFPPIKTTNQKLLT